MLFISLLLSHPELLKAEALIFLRNLAGQSNLPKTSFIFNSAIIQKASELILEHNRPLLESVSENAATDLKELFDPKSGRHLITLISESLDKKVRTKKVEKLAVREVNRA